MLFKNRKRRNADSLCEIFTFFKLYIRLFTYGNIINFGRIPIKSET